MVAESTGQTVRRVEVVAVLGGSAVLAGSWIIAAANHGVGGWEEDIFERVNDLPDFLWPVVWGPMQLGSLAGSLVVVAVTFATTRQKRLTLAALTASQTAFWSAKVIKGVVSRGRPAALLANVKLREKASGVGYVSGHTAVAFALAAVLAPSVPRAWRPAVFAIASFVALARMYSGAHLPLDVVGGAGLGLVCGVVARRVFAVVYSSPRRRS
jgi:membrane-associated phospholipid phosphatase